MTGNPFNLTPRECQVMALVCEGLSNTQIGERTRTSRRNAQERIACAVQKMEIDAENTRVAAAIKFDRAMRSEA